MKISNAIYALLVLGVTLTRVEAKLPAMNFPSGSPSYMVVNANTIVIGKVAGIESEIVELSSYAGASKDLQKTPWRVAKIKISESLLGAKGVTQIQVGFPAAAAESSDDNDKLDRLGRSSWRGFAFEKEQEGLFILTRHWEGDFYILAHGTTFVPSFFDKKATDYDKCLAEAKLAINTIKDPITALKSKNKEERIASAALLTRYYRIKDNSKKHTEEKLSAEESKLILQALTEMEWTNAVANPFGDPYQTLGQSMSVWLADEMRDLKYQSPHLAAGLTLDECHKLYKDTATKFINDNIDKFTLKKFVEKK